MFTVKKFGNTDGQKKEINTKKNRKTIFVIQKILSVHTYTKVESILNTINMTYAL